MASNDKDWLDRLIKSPLYAKLNRIEKMLKNLNGDVGAAVYRDDKDQEYECEGVLTERKPNELGPIPFVVFKFGDFVIKLLDSKFKLPQVQIMPAASLPKNDYVKNAYRNSIYYDKDRGVLYVRDKRLDNVGDYAVMIVHCMAHLLIGDFTDDSNPLVVKNFYKMMAVCNQDVFHQRTLNVEPKSLVSPDMKEKFVKDPEKFASDLLNSTIKQRVRK
ncbi:hypothetical protein AKO1_000181 [Acrasis kona]|uniref:Uncharacterized protein n=1 Tax=Acrasis kona TaxID=1008807 RepID=A0AAW2ZEA1_9EUKA